MMMVWTSLWTWESISEETKPSATDSLVYYELKYYKTWFNEECSKLLYKRKQAELQRLQNPSQTEISQKC
jgi:hypothetical protein